MSTQYIDILSPSAQTMKDQDDLFPCADRKLELHQWFTPAWAAECIVEQEFAWLRQGHRVIEPSCGDGAFLCALPDHIQAIGVEIDPLQASRSRKNSGRKVILGDFLTLDLDTLGRADAVIGNPPFDSAIVAAFLDRSSELLDEGGQVGFILPSYILQTSSRVEQMSSKFSIKQSLIPRNLFPRLKLPLVFATFTKERHRKLHGFLLYREAQDIAATRRCWRKGLIEGRSRNAVWYPIVREIVAMLGGEARLEQIYEAIEDKRPTENPHWRAKVRQILQNTERFKRTADARYAIAQPAV